MAIEELYLFDVNEELIDIIPGEELLEHGQTQELKKLITINASALYSEDLEQAVFVGHRDIDNSNVFHQYRVTKFKNNNGIVEIEGVHTFFDDMQAYGFIKDKRPTDATVSTALGGILEGSRWQLGVIQSAHSATSNYYYVSRLEAFWDFVEKWNVEFKLRMVYSDGAVIARYVDIYDQLSADYGKWYEYGDQLLTVEKEEDRQGVYTALIGRGKGEETEAGGFGRSILFSDVEWTIAGGDPVDKPLLQDYVELPSATAQYGYSDGTPRIGIVEFEDVTDKALLLDATYQTLLNNCRPQVQFKAGVDEKGVSELGEIVAIIRDDLNIRYKTRVYKLRRNFLDVMDKEFTFGDKLTTTQGERSVQVNKEIKKQQQQTISWLEVVNAAMMSMFWNEDGYNYTFSATNDYGLPGGFYSFNAPIDMNPTKCIYMGAGMLAIANSKLPDGSWNFRTWGTGDGFTADLITTGTLRADLVQTGFNNIAQGVNITEDGIVTQNGELLTQISGGEITAVSGTKAGEVNALGMEISDSANGQVTKLFSDGIEFRWYSIIRQILQTSEGLVIKPLTGSAERLNSSLRLETGPGNDKVAYLELSIPDQPSKARVQLSTTTMSLMHPNNGNLVVSDFAFDGSKGIIFSGKFRTNPTDGNYLDLTGNQISSRTGAEDQTIYITPNGGGSVVIGNKDIDRYPITALRFVESSNRDSKTNIAPFIGNGESVINDLTVVTYNRKQDLRNGIEQTEIGFIAEDSLPIQAFQPDGTPGINNYLTVAYLVKASQEMSEKITAQVAEISNLKQELADLKALLTEKGVI